MREREGESDGEREMVLRVPLSCEEDGKRYAGERKRERERERGRKIEKGLEDQRERVEK